MFSKLKQFTYLAFWFIRARFFGRKAPLQSVIFISDKCNLQCKHCSVYQLVNPNIKSYEQVCLDTDRDNYLTAQQALEYGIIDKVIDKRI